MLLTGTAFYAASKAKTFPGFLWSFAQYAVIILAIFVAVWFVAKALRIEYFDECRLLVDRPRAETRSAPRLREMCGSTECFSPL
jgi:hypothetical protein